MCVDTQTYGWQEFAKAAVSGVRTDTYSFYVAAVILFALGVIASFVSSILPMLLAFL